MSSKTFHGYVVITVSLVISALLLTTMATSIWYELNPPKIPSDSIRIARNRPGLETCLADPHSCYGGFIVARRDKQPLRIVNGNPMVETPEGDLLGSIGLEQLKRSYQNDPDGTLSVMDAVVLPNSPEWTDTEERYDRNR